MIRVTDTVVLSDDEVKERFVRAAGPGGQNINKGSDRGRIARRYWQIIAPA